MHAGAVYADSQRRAKPMDIGVKELTDSMGRLRGLRNYARDHARSLGMAGMRFEDRPPRQRQRQAPGRKGAKRGRTK